MEDAYLIERSPQNYTSLCSGIWLWYFWNFTNLLSLLPFLFNLPIILILSSMNYFSRNTVCILQWNDGHVNSTKLMKYYNSILSIKLVELLLLADFWFCCVCFFILQLCVCVQAADMRIMTLIQSKYPLL